MRCGGVRRSIKIVWSADFGWVNDSQGTFLDLVGRTLSNPWILEIFTTTAWFL